MDQIIKTGTPLNALVLEDSEMDFDILCEQLIRAGYDTKIFRVESEKKFESTLRTSAYDIILADFKLPGFDGFGALRIRNEICPDTPFICVSGTIGEETSIELLKCGANDFVLKDRLSRLPFAIKHSIDEALEKKKLLITEAKIKSSEKRYRRLFEAAKDGILILDAETGKIDDVNPYLVNLLDTTYEDLCGKVLWEIGEFKDIIANKENFITLQQQEYIRYDDLPLVTKSGRKIPVEFVSNVYLVDDHKVIQCNIRDISIRKQEELKLKEAQENYQLFAENVTDVLWVIDLKKKRFKFCSPSVLKLRGYTVEEVLQQTIHEALSPRSIDYVQKILPERIKNFIDGKPESVSFHEEVEQLCKDGSTVWTEISSTIVVNAAGQMEIVGVSRNITERKKAEDTLRENEERLRLSLAAVNQGLFDLNLDTNEVIVNDEYATMLGYDPATFVESNTLWMERLHPDDKERSLRIFREYLSGILNEYRIEYRLRTRSGGWKWILSLGKIIEHADDGRPLRMLGTHTDIDEIKRSEELLLLQTTALESTANGIVITDLDGHIVWANNSFSKITGYAVEEVQGGNPSILKSGKQSKEFYEQMWETIRSGNIWRGTLINKRKDGTLYDEEMTITPVRNKKNIITHFIAVKQDITEQFKAFQQIKDQAMLLDEAHDAIILRDMNYSILYWNKGAENVFGWKKEEVIGKDIRTVIYLPETDYQQELDQLYKSGNFSGEFKLRTKKDQSIIVDIRMNVVNDREGKPKSVMSMSNDVTEKKNLESQILRTQRLESLGTLAGGIAHDLNNVLSPILLSIEILKRLSPTERGKKILSAIESSAQRGAEIVKQILSFARGLETKKDYIQSRYLIAEIISIFKETFPRSIKLVSEVPNSIWTILADPTHFHQLLMNLGVNARDAMPHGGTLTISAENVIIDEQYARMNIHAHPGKFVKFMICDTGTGMTPEVIDHIYEPFFTTKEIGMGTGLGLSTVHTIITSHNGFIEIESELEKGSTFNIFIPASDVETIDSDVSDNIDLFRGNGETILVVDDEISVVEVTKDTLELFNYNVITAADGADALTKFAMQRSTISLVITDMMMPIMDGHQLIIALRRMNPQLKIIASSGLIDKNQAGEEGESGIQGFLHKPYTADKLLQSVKQILQ